MQLFSQKKTIFALSIAALALGACGDDVTVSGPPESVTITPPSATMNVGESLNFAVQITGGDGTVTLTGCTTSNAAVATAAVNAGACRVTALAPGNITVTATTSTNVSAAASVTVNPQVAAISNLTVSPTTANMTPTQTIQIATNYTRAPGYTATPTTTYQSLASAVATVSPAGVITAVAPGQATIVTTVSASGAGFGTANLTAQTIVNVTAAPSGITALTVQPASLAMAVGSTAGIVASAQQPTGANAATFTYGSNTPGVATVAAGATAGQAVVTAVAPGTAVITVTAQSTANANFGASSVTQLVPVTVSPSAQVIINSLTDNGAVIDITNVAGQFEVNLQIAPNGQNVSSVQTFVCEQGEAQAACIARGPAAQQTFGSAGAQAGPVQLYINSAEFTPPNFTTGADANTLFKNGLKTIVATLTTTPASTGVNASNNLSQINFNNQDGWTIQWTQPSNKANDANGITWYGGPTPPDALVPGSTSGAGSFVVVPVLYTPGRSIQTATLGMNNGLACGNSILDTERPFAASYSTSARSTAQASINFNCSGAASTTAGYVPSVVASVDNNNAAGPAASGGDTGPVAATSIYTPINAAAAGNPAFAGRYRQSLTFRPTTIYIPGDYLAPVVSFLDVKNGGNSVETGWTNASYAFHQVDGNGNQLTYGISDANVGLFPTASRNTVFDVCAVPATISTTAPTTCSPVVATGGLTATVGSMNLPEHAANFTNQAYFVIARETDRLGNRVTTNPYAYDPPGSAPLVPATPGTTAPASGVASLATVNPQSFGVDVTAPVVVAIPNTGLGANPNYARTDIDSIYATVASGLNVAGNLAADNAQFGVRFTDARSGFPICTATNCPAANAAQARGGSFQIVRRSAPAAPSVTNDAVVQNLVAGATTAANTMFNAINANVGTFSGDPAIREFYVNIAGEAARNNVAGFAPAIGFAQAGYYTFSGSLVDRAGNTTALTQRSVAVDNARPVIGGLTVPPVLAGGTAVAFGPTGTDDLEVVSGELALNYPHLGRLNSGVAVSQPTAMRFRRVPNFSATTVLGLWHNPFAAITDNKLATPIGAGTLLYDANPGLKVPVGFIQQLSVVTAGNAPVAPLGLAAFTDIKPDSVKAWLYDVRGTSTTLFTDSGRSVASTLPIASAQVPTAASKDWTAAVGGAGIQTWAAFNTTGGTIEFRATTSSSITNPPFTRVSIVRLNTTDNTWEYLGEAVNAGPFDQGGNRFWRYTFSFAGVNQGQFSMAGLATGDVVRAIGIDASGNGLSTQNASFGNPPVFTTETVTLSAPAPASMADAAANFVATVGASANPVGAALTYSCTSSNPALIAASIVGAVCTLDAVGTAIGVQPVTVTFSVTGALAGYSTSTIVSTVVINRTP